jgi:ABC-type transport system substrate-binding protein
MRAYKLTAVMLAAVATAVLALASTPSEAQTTTAQKRQETSRVATAGRTPARVTVRKRTYLDPGTATRARAEHYSDYAYPPDNSVMMNSTLFNSGPGLPVMNNRMPFPNCFDLAGFCR